MYIKPEAEALSQAMKAMYLKPPAERQAMGSRGREYVLKNFARYFSGRSPDWRAEDKARQLFGYLQEISSNGK